MRLKNRGEGGGVIGGGGGGSGAGGFHLCLLDPKPFNKSIASLIHSID